MKASGPLLIGASASASLIAGLLLGFNKHPGVKHISAQKDDTIQIVMPGPPA
jgi:hypothetical protein